METLAVVTRSGYVESIHKGYISVVDSDNNIIYEKGNTNMRIFFRSAAKPIQIIPFIQSGGARATGYSLKEIAVGCASHSGQPEHQKTVEGILKRLNLEKSDLHCGVMGPYNEEEKRRLLSSGEEPSTLHVSCSGKHAAMLAYSKYLGSDISHYEDPSHPVQQKILKTISEFTDEKVDSIPVGIDGCGVPICMLPINKIALAYARLAGYARDRDSIYHETCKTIFEAMTGYPEMIAGEGEFCTELMRTTGDRLIGKVGAEAVYCLAIKKGNLGVCVKIADGGERAVWPVVMQLLLELKVLEASEYEKLKKWHKAELVNNLKEHIGNIIPVFQNNRELHLGDIPGTS